MKPTLIFLVTEDWYFWSHRLPVAKAALGAGFNVVVATRVTSHGRKIESEGFKLVPLPWRRSGLPGLADLATLRDLIQLYRRHQGALLHHVALKAVLFGGVAALFARPKGIVAAIAGLGWAFTARGMAASTFASLISFVLRYLLSGHRVRVIVQNPDDGQIVSDRFGVDKERIRLIEGSGVDMAQYAMLPLPPHQPLPVALIARMLRIKGIETAVAAVAAVNQQAIRVRLILAGGPDPGNPASLTEQELQLMANTIPGVEWRGHVSNPQTIWAEAALALQPSLGGEGIPKSLIEAAACGRAAIASDVPGCRSVVRHGQTGFLFPPGDVEALTRLLADLADDPGRLATLGAQAREEVAARMSADHVARETLALYREISGV